MKIFDRARNQIGREDVYGDFFIRLAYSHPGAKLLMNSEIFQKSLSHAIGFWQRRGFSKRAIPEFIRRYQIHMQDFIEPAGGYGSFNEFFIRKLSPRARPFPGESAQMGALAEGRLSVFRIEGAQTRLSIKGRNLALVDLLGSVEDAAPFAWGHAFVFRLCPVDYHRFHFPDSGMPAKAKRLGSKLHSVNPLAQAALPELFLFNERQVTHFRSEHFGPVLIIEVGAMGVGAIYQTFVPSMPVERGAEKGYFSFGGSTVIMLTQKAHLEPDKDLLERTDQGLESLVRLGEKIAQSSTR